jgi:hypothetical protein
VKNNDESNNENHSSDNTEKKSPMLLINYVFICSFIYQAVVFWSVIVIENVPSMSMDNEILKDIIPSMYLLLDSYKRKINSIKFHDEIIMYFVSPCLLIFTSAMYVYLRAFIKKRLDSVYMIHMHMNSISRSSSDNNKEGNDHEGNNREGDDHKENTQERKLSIKISSPTENVRHCDDQSKDKHCESDNNEENNQENNNVKVDIDQKEKTLPLNYSTSSLSMNKISVGTLSLPGSLLVINSQVQKDNVNGCFTPSNTERSRHGDVSNENRNNDSNENNESNRNNTISNRNSYRNSERVVYPDKRQELFAACSHMCIMILFILNLVAWIDIMFIICLCMDCDQLYFMFNHIQV